MTCHTRHCTAHCPNSPFAVARPVAWISWAVLAAVFSLSSATAFATEKPARTNEHQWSEWRALGNGGYVARRRQPPGLDKKVQQRALSGTPKPKVTANSNSINKTPALWLHTLAEGLYSVSIAGLADTMGEDTGRVRRKAKRGALSITNDNRPTPWLYDADADALIFVGESYNTFYTDQNAYHFSLGKRKAAPMRIATGEPSGTTGSAVPFRESLKFEEEPDMIYSTATVAAEPDADYWFWDYLYGGFKDLIEVSLTIPDPEAAGTAQLRVTLRGWTDLEAGDEHQVYAEINGVEVGTGVIWDGFEQAILVAEFDQSLLQENGENILALRNIYPAGTHPGQWLDQVEIDYSRQPIAHDDSLWMHDVAAGVQTATGFSSDAILVIESPGAEAVLREDVNIYADEQGGWAVDYEAYGGTDYLIVNRAALSAPTLALDYRSALKSRKNQADYLIIAPRNFAGTAAALSEHRSAQFSDVKIVWLDDIYDEFNAGRKDPSALGRFMQKAMKKWRVTPSYVVLIGKGSLDEKDRMGYGDNFLPIKMASNPWALAASDTRLLGFEVETPFALGRLPIISDAEGLAFLEKLSLYETTIPGVEHFNAVLVADNPDSAGDFPANSEILANRLETTLGFDLVTQLHHPRDQVRASLTVSETWNTGYVSYDGHGSTSQVGNGSENFINAADAALLSNTGNPIFTALTCAAGDDSIPGTRSLAGALVLNPLGGAIGSVAPTGLSLDNEAQILSHALTDNLFRGGNTIGNAVLEAKSQTRGIISDFMPNMYSIVGDPATSAR